MTTYESELRTKVESDPARREEYIKRKLALDKIMRLSAIVGILLCVVGYGLFVLSYFFSAIPTLLSAYGGHWYLNFTQPGFMVGMLAFFITLYPPQNRQIVVKWTVYAASVLWVVGGLFMLGLIVKEINTAAQCKNAGWPSVTTPLPAMSVFADSIALCNPPAPDDFNRALWTAVFVFSIFIALIWVGMGICYVFIIANNDDLALFTDKTELSTLLSGQNNIKDHIQSQIGMVMGRARENGHAHLLNEFDNEQKEDQRGEYRRDREYSRNYNRVPIDNY